MNQTVLLETKLPGFPDPKRGKVRDIYDLGDYLLIVATDRISAFDVVMANGIPGKGRMLTEMAVFWFHWIVKRFPFFLTHYIASDWGAIRHLCPALDKYREPLEGRSMLVWKVKILPVEAVVRGYLCGSAWKDYQKSGETSGVKLPRGLREAEKLEKQIFTPATKAQTGHDENINWEKMVELVGPERAFQIKGNSLLVYSGASDFASNKCVIILDTKFEWGVDGNGRMRLADEVLTPDSSRFVLQDEWKPGGPQPSLDKQYVRDYLEEEVKAGRWNKNPPGPELPEDVVKETAKRYQRALSLLTT